ncbi:MAG: hypothetical protein ACK417_01165 [Bacteroidia bacterium]
MLVANFSDFREDIKSHFNQVAKKQETRIDLEHRLIYRYEEGEVQMLKCWFYYD